VKIDDDECWRRVEVSRHGVLVTLNESRGADPVPVVFAVDHRRIVLPVDSVKAKRHDRLARLDNIRRDPRCAMLVEHYSEDWSQLWWVRVHATATEAALSESTVSLLAARYEQYSSPGALTGAIVLTPTSVSGWSAE
jgi:PPOX class probable F420-dependent enzyme